MSDETEDELASACRELADRLDAFGDLRVQLIAKHAQVDLLVEALAQSRLAVDDLLAMYARDQVGQDTFRRAQSRVNGRGGVLAYVAETQRMSTEALAAVEAPEHAPGGEQETP